MRNHMTKTEAENTELVNGFVKEVLVEGDLERIDEYVAEDYVGHNSSVPEDIHGPEGFREFVTMLRSAFPDFDVTIQDLIADDNKVCQRSRQSGTHEGAFMGLEPTGKEVESSGIVIYQIEDGQIVEDWAQIDMLGTMQQLGVIEPPGE